MDSLNIIILASLTLTISFVFYFAYKTSLYYKKIEKSFSKLGYIIREDSKNIFKNSTGDFNQQKISSLEDSKRLIVEALSEAVSQQKKDSAVIVSNAYAQADKIIKEARFDADNIVKQASEKAEKLHQKAVEKCSYMIESTITEYVENTCKDSDHEKIIKSIISNLEMRK